MFVIEGGCMCHLKQVQKVSKTVNERFAIHTVPYYHIFLLSRAG